MMKKMISLAATLVVAATSVQADFALDGAHVLHLQEVERRLFPYTGEIDEEPQYVQQKDAQFGYSLAINSNSLIIGVPRLRTKKGRIDASGIRGGGVFQLVGVRNRGVIGHSNDRLLTQATRNMPGGVETGDRFGHSVAVGFFADNSRTCHTESSIDCGGYLDLLVGVPKEAIGDLERAGMVNIWRPGEITDFYGAGSLVRGDDSLELISQSGNAIKGTAEAGDQFGYSMAVGDFNDDGADDVAIGAPYEDVGNYDNAGGVNIVMGDSFLFDPSAEGLTGANDQVWSQQNLPGQRKANEHFGAALATGDFNKDGVADLVIGVPKDNIVKGKNAQGGSVQIIYGKKHRNRISNSGGLSMQISTDGTFFSQNTDGIAGDAEDNDKFGAALAVGDFNKDNILDLAIGVPGENIGGVVDAGMVHILFGRRDRRTGDIQLSGERSQSFHQGTKGVPGSNERGDLFGYRLVAGDFDGNGATDLAIAGPGEDVKFRNRNHANAGAVWILYGQGGVGLRTSDAKFLHQGKITGTGFSTPFANMRFGWSLAAGDLNGDDRDDLAIGSNGYVEPIRRSVDSTVTILYQNGVD